MLSGQETAVGMIPNRPQPQLIALKKLAEELAGTRKERVTSAHLLAAIASRDSAARDLLRDRQLTAEQLLRAARASTDDIPDPIKRAHARARDVASRMGAREAGAEHLLVALLSEPRGAAYRALEQCGNDVSRLRVAAMNVGLGLLGRRRIVTRQDRRESQPAQRASLSRVPGQTIPLVPKPAPRPPAPSTPARPVRQSMQSDRTRDSKPPQPTDAANDTPAPISDVVPKQTGASTIATPAKPKVKAAKQRTKAKTASIKRFQLNPKKFPALTGLGKNLTLQAALGELDPVVGRCTEVDQALDVLAKRQGNNPVLIGQAGVGKTSVVRALAQSIADGRGVHSLDDRIVIEIPVTELLAGTGVRGALAERLGAIKKEVAASEGRVVIFFDEIHQLFVGDGCEEIVGELKLALARGEMPCIGATTVEEYTRIIEGDAALARRFTAVEVEEPSREEAFLVLEALSDTFAEHHGVGYDEDALALTIAWSVKYLPGRALPDKAVSIIDLAGARVRRRSGGSVTREAVAEVVSELADIPIERLLETDRERMLKLEELLAGRVIGHEGQLRKVAKILRRNAAGLNGRRPIGTFMLLGPTGVGKTETAKAIADILFFNETAMTRIDLSEYSEAHSVARLIGAPPGYVGHEGGGQLTEAVRKRPYQVVLLDEIEKAHPEVLETFLGVFDEGRLTDSKGRTVDFTNCVLMLTSNIGAREASGPVKRRVGFGNGGGDDDGDVRERKVIEAAKATLSPELYNRIDEVLVFRALERSDVSRIARRLLGGLERLLASRGVALQIDDAAIDVLLDSGGFEPTLGARPMKRAIARLVEAPLADKLLAGELKRGDVALIGAAGGKLTFDVVEPAAATA